MSLQCSILSRLKNPKTKNMKSYILTTSAKPDSLQARLVAISQPGKPGENIIRAGFSTSGFNRLMAEIAHKAITVMDKSPAELAIILGNYSAGNASACRQRYGELSIQFLDEDGKPEMTEPELDEDGEVTKPAKPKVQSLAAYWGKNPSQVSALAPDEIAGMF